VGGNTLSRGRINNMLKRMRLCLQTQPELTREMSSVSFLGQPEMWEAFMTTSGWTPDPNGALIATYVW
ncbi:MAG: hypothetical protein LBS98_02715, partial [Coriobacteriales bacterium]|nr:hypothetical protein [Coriobacteriales bacterium]